MSRNKTQSEPSSSFKQSRMGGISLFHHLFAKANSSIVLTTSTSVVDSKFAGQKPQTPTSCPIDHELRLGYSLQS